MILIGDEEPVMQGVVRKRSRPVVSPEIVIDEEEPVPPCVGGKKPRPADEWRSGKARACAASKASGGVPSKVHWTPYFNLYDHSACGLGRLALQRSFRCCVNRRLRWVGLRCCGRFAAAFIVDHHILHSLCSACVLTRFSFHKFEKVVVTKPCRNLSDGCVRTVQDIASRLQCRNGRKAPPPPS